MPIRRKWKRECRPGWPGTKGAATALLDMGAPLTSGRLVASDGVRDSDKQVTGYSILQAEDMDAAVKMLDGHPHLGWMEGCEIGVCEVIPLPGM